MEFSTIGLENKAKSGILIILMPIKRRRKNAMLFKNITILDENLEVREHMFVGTDGARIAPMTAAASF